MRCQVTCHQQPQRGAKVAVVREDKPCTDGKNETPMASGNEHHQKSRERQGLTYRPVRPNRRSPVPVYRSGLAGNRSEPVKFKFEFKSRRAIGSDRLTGRLDRFTGRFDWFTGQFDR